MVGPWKSISYVVKFGGVSIAFNILFPFREMRDHRN
jgi:hypothetical protein